MGDGIRFSGMILKEKILFFKDAEVDFSQSAKKHTREVFKQISASNTKGKILFTNRKLKNLLLSEIYDNLYKSIIHFDKIGEDMSGDKTQLRKINIQLIYNFLKLNGLLCLEDKELCENGVLVINIVDISRDTYNGEVYIGVKFEDYILSKYVELCGINQFNKELGHMDLSLDSQHTFEELIRKINYSLYHISSHGTSRFDYMNYRNKILSYIHGFYKDEEKKKRILRCLRNRHNHKPQ